MSKVYPNNTIGAPLAISQEAPIDDRLSVTDKSDLLTMNFCYDGMIVSVVGGENQETNSDNGVYMLIRSDQSDKQSWDSSAANYDIAGWRRIDGYAENITGVNGGEIPQTGNSIHN